VAAYSIHCWRRCASSAVSSPSSVSVESAGEPPDRPPIAWLGLGFGAGVRVRVWAGVWGRVGVRLRLRLRVRVGIGVGDWGWGRWRALGMVEPGLRVGVELAREENALPEALLEGKGA
jgi:hypothetical protein